MIREGRYKLFLGDDRRPEKLVDLENDPEEKKDLSGNPEYAEVLAKLMAPLAGMPEMDHDPKHGQLEPQPWWKTAKKKSKVHKLGYPGD